MKIDIVIDETTYYVGIILIQFWYDDTHVSTGCVSVYALVGCTSSVLDHIAQAENEMFLKKLSIVICVLLVRLEISACDCKGGRYSINIIKYM